MDAALAELSSCESPNISMVARTHGVNRSTLSRRFRLMTTDLAQHHESKRLLNNAQEKELVKHIKELCERCFPPTPRIVANIASELCGTRPSKNWSSGFVARHKDELDARFLNAIDLSRHKADSRASYERYFASLAEKVDGYNILPENMYNMDEKGFLLGRLQKTQRVFAKDSQKHSKLVGPGQDGSREWITLVASKCADGTRLPPTLIYKAVSGVLQDIWLDEFEPSEQACYFTSSQNGWTSDELGYSWSTGLFEKETAAKAKRSWRLLIVDGHGSHLNMKFLNWCENHRILVVVFPPHSTHRLQPLDVSVFAPLAHCYSQALDDLVRQSEGRTSISKRDFFSLFWPAFENAFTKKNIFSAWSKTGLMPFNPSKVLDVFSKAEDESRPSQRAERPSSDSAGSVFSSPSKPKRLRTVLNATAARSDKKTQKTLRKLGDTVLGLSARLTLSELRTKQLDAALRHEKKRRKRQKKVVEELRASEGSGALILSPTRVQKARDIQEGRAREKEQLSRERELRAHERAQEKARKEEEVREKRAERARASAARKKAAEEKRAAKTRMKKAQGARRQRETKLRCLSGKSRGRPKKQSDAQRSEGTRIEVAVEAPVKQRVTRSGRSSRRPARFDV